MYLPSSCVGTIPICPREGILFYFGGGNPLATAVPQQLKPFKKSDWIPKQSKNSHLLSNTLPRGYGGKMHQKRQSFVGENTPQKRTDDGESLKGRKNGISDCVSQGANRPTMNCD